MFALRTGKQQTMAEIWHRKLWLDSTRLLLRVSIGLGLLVLIVTLTPLVSWWGGLLAGPWEDPSGEVLIVLGGGDGGDGILDGGSYLRSQYAILAYREGGFRTVILSGGGTPIPVAFAMRDFLSCQGVPLTVMRVDPLARSTRENAVNTNRLLQDLPGRKVLLTSDYHMFRALRAFRKVGLDVVSRPFPDVRKRATSWRGRWPAFLDIVEESVKIGYYFGRGWI